MRGNKLDMISSHRAPVLAITKIPDYLQFSNLTR